MKYLLSLILVLCSLQLTVAQDKPRLDFRKNKIRTATGLISLKEAQSIMVKYPEAQYTMKKARRKLTIAHTLGFMGGFFIGAPIGEAVAGGEPNWTLMAIGGLTLLAALPFNSAFKKNAALSIDLYNSARPVAHYRKPQIKIGLLEAGVGLKLSF